MKQTKSLTERVDDMVNDAFFRAEFPLYIEKENSTFGKLLLQENLISSEVIALIVFLKHAGNKFCEGELSELGFKITIDISELETYTLRQLANLLKKFLEKEKFHKKLDNYITMRNGITHKMLIKYQSFEQLNTDAERMLIMGAIILVDLENISDDFVKLLR